MILSLPPLFILLEVQLSTVCSTSHDAINIHSIFITAETKSVHCTSICCCLTERDSYYSLPSYPTAVMYTSRFILSSLSILACWGTETVSGTANDVSDNFNGLVLALKDLDYGSLSSSSAPDLFLLNSPAKNSSNGCAVTVSMNE